MTIIRFPQAWGKVMLDNIEISPNLEKNYIWQHEFPQASVQQFSNFPRFSEKLRLAMSKSFCMTIHQLLQIWGNYVWQRRNLHKLLFDDSPISTNVGNNYVWQHCNICKFLLKILLFLQICGKITLGNIAISESVHMTILPFP